MTPVRVRVVGDSGLHDADPGYVGARLVERGAMLSSLDRDALVPYDRLDRPDLLLLLGSARSVREQGSAEVVEAESRLVRDARDDGVPVIGICYGAQLAAHAFGGVVTTAAEPELGWYEVDSDDPLLCPSGPWPQYHFDAFVPPPGARVLGRSAAGVQAFALDRLIGWQFHPEASAGILRRWLDDAPADAAAVGADPDEIVARAYACAAEARAATYALTDAALAYLGA